MSWFRLEGRGAFHFKVIAAGDEPYGAWCRAGQWSTDQLTDGFVPEGTALLINRKAKVWARLCEVNLLEKVDGGYQIHDFLDFNPSSEQERSRREETREKRRAAGKIGGKRSGETRRGEAEQKQNTGAPPEQTGSKDEANGKQVASIPPKQNEAPIPSPNPIPKEEQTHTFAGARGASAKDDAVDHGLGNLATPEVLIAIVGRHPTLRLLHGNDRWAQGAGAITATKLVRREDAEAAVEGFLLKQASRAWNNVDDLSAALGGYLAKAKEHGDAARARRSREAERAAPRGQHRAGPMAPDPAKAPFVPVEGPVWTPETP